MVEIPQKHDIAGVGYTTMLTPTGEMVLSEHSLVEVQALADEYKQGDVNNVYFAAEKTFGVKNPSTSLLAADTLVELGIPSSRIHISEEGLDNTESQIIWLAQQNPQDLELLALGFHCLRNRILMWQHGLPGRVVNAENVIKENHPEATDIRKIVETKQKIGGVVPALYPIEGAMVVATALGDKGKAAISWARARKGAEGATVTSYEGLTSADSVLEDAAKKGLTLHYQYRLFGYQNMQGAEANQLLKDVLPVIH